MIEIKGSLERTPLANVFHRAREQEFKGTIVFKHFENEVKTVWENGKLISVGTRNANFRMGEVLVVSGRISLQDYERSVAVMLDRGLRQGEAFLHLGVMQQDQIDAALQLQMREIVYWMFRWEGGEFEAHHEFTVPFVELETSIYDLIVRGLARTQSWAKIREELYPYQQVFELNTSVPREDAKTIRLKAFEQNVLSYVDGHSPVQKIIDRDPNQSFEIARLIYALKYARVIRLKLDGAD